ncbi:MAG: DNA primase, partial [Candidatus Melainabacteria bacterium]|nr:DNA primase [Candidatus Melainabacteria bacterium]
MRLISLQGVTSEIIAEVRSRANLLEVISELVVLKRAGKEHRGLCPFHPEKTPSFYVNPEKGIYKCFGCGEGGDVFAFVRKTKGFEFLDAVRELARRYGVRLVESEKDQEEHDKRALILMLYQQAALYYARLLADEREGCVAQAYLKKRGIDAEMISAFKLGYAPSTWDGLIHYLTSVSKITPKTLEEAGLARCKLDSGHYFDLFRDRLMIPICDNEGRVIAFGGRTLN